MLPALVQHISEIVVVIDAKGTIRFSSPRVEAVLGLRAENVVGRNIFDFIHPNDVHRARMEYAETVQKPGEAVPSALRIRDAGGEWIPFEIIANNQLQDRDIQGVIFTARDLRFRREIEKAILGANADAERHAEERITELAKANAALRLENQSRRETEKRLQETISLLNATLNSTADGILVVSTEGKVSSCNQHFVEMWHLPCDSVLGHENQTLLTTVADQLQNPDEFLHRVQTLYSDPSAISEDVLHFKDGRIYERYSQPQRLGEQIVGRVWSFRDVTQARHLEEELRHSQKMEAMGRLAGGIAHDFNNLLMLILAYLGRLAESGLAPEQRTMSEEAIAATKRAASLTRQLLAFSRKQRETPTVTDLNTVVSNMQAMLRSLVSERIRLDLALSDDPVPVLADVLQLEIVVLNLAINARDAMPDGGWLEITTGRLEQDSRTFAVLTVSDTGRGMTPEIKAHIFEPFFTTKLTGKGTGLGLSTVHGIVQRCGGHIELESEPDHGTQFRIYLPGTTAAPMPTIAALTSSPPAGGPETILLAEDEAGIRAMTRTYLEGLGYTVIEAADGSEAVRISDEYEGAIDLVLTDILMPVLRGDEAVNAIRERRAGVKTLYISGYSEDHIADDFEDVLYKPFEFPELGRRVRSVLDADSATQRCA